MFQIAHEVLKGNGKVPSGKKVRWMVDDASHDMMQVTITPAVAREMLKYNDRNRPLSRARVNDYSAEMKAGRWHYTRVPIIFSDQKRLIDGQHRLVACIEAGVAFEADVVFGAPDDSFYYIDVGKARGASDIFSINGVPNASMAAAATRFLMSYDANKTSGQHALGSLRPNLETVYQTYVRYEAKGKLQESIRVGLTFAGDRLPCPSVCAAVHYLCAQKSRTAADEYFHKIGSGVGIQSRRDPAYKVRDYLIRGHDSALRQREVAAALIAGWNAMRTGKPLGRLENVKMGRVT